MTPKEEEYVHHAECCVSLNQAWLILKELQTATVAPVIYDASFRFALVAYAKPYTGSNGRHKKYRNAYKLKLPALSSEEVALHQQILDLRDQVLAHSDLTVKEASLTLSRYKGRANGCIGQNFPEPLPSIEAVIGLVEHTLDLLIAEQASLLETLV